MLFCLSDRRGFIAFFDIDDFAIERGDIVFMRGEAHGAMRWLFLFDVWHDTPAREGAFDLYDV